MENFAAVLREIHTLIALLLAGYFALKTSGPERIALVSLMLTVIGGLITR